MRFFIALLVSILLLPSAVSAADIYVSPSGSGISCSLSNPCSLSTANSNAQAGDTVFLRAGTYTTAISPSNSGSEGDYITYTNYNDEEAVITKSGDGVILTNREYIILDGIRIIGVGDSWIDMDGAQHCIIRNCYMRTANGWSGISMRESSNYNKILNNTLIGTCLNGVGGPKDSISIRQNSHHNLVEGNIMDYAAHTSIGVYFGSHHTVIRNNRVYNPWHSCIQSPDSDYILMENNIVLDGGEICGAETCPSNECGQERDRTGMRREDHGGLRINGENCIVRNNVVVNTGTAFTFASYDHNGMEIISSDNRIYHNTFSRNIRGIYVNNAAEDRPATDHIMKNNIISDSEEYSIWVFITGTAPRDNYYVNNNIVGSSLRFQNQPYGSLTELVSAYPQYFIQNIEESPGFVNPAGINDHDNSDLDPEWLYLESSSPMIDAADFLTYTTSSGSGSRSIEVDDARYFMDGWGIIEPDTIQIGSQLAVIDSIDFETNTVTVKDPVSWQSVQGVSLAYSGSAPDIGAFEYIEETPSPYCGDGKCEGEERCDVCIEDCGNCSITSDYQTQYSEDTLLEYAYPDYDYGGLDTFYIGSRSDGWAERVLLRFPGLISPDAIPRGSDIESATLTLTSTGTHSISSPIDLRIRMVLESWSEGDASSAETAGHGESTWDYRYFDDERWSSDIGADGGEDAGCGSGQSHTSAGKASKVFTTNPGEGEQSIFDVTSIVQEWSNEGESSNHGFILIAPNQEMGSKNYVRFASSEFPDTGYRPSLNVSFSIDISHPADTSGDGCVTMNELTAFIQKWKQGLEDVTMPEVMEAVGLWRQGTGC